jgi:hypothetical protein
VRIERPDGMPSSRRSLISARALPVPVPVQA